jgi:outer membrane lipase/esterase
MPKMRQLAITATLLATTALSMPGAVGAAEFNQFVVFGDSTLDTGYFRYHTSGNQQFDAAMNIAIQFGATGGWAGNGVMNTTILAGKFGLSAASNDNGGANYANGGATTMNDLGRSVPDNIYTIQQIRNYLSDVHGAANPNGLYLIKTGDNDATYVTTQIANDPNWLAHNSTYLDDVAAALAPEVASLQAAGARTIVVRNSYDSALFAGPGGDISGSNTAAYARSKALGVSEWHDLTARGVHFIPADNDSLFSFIAHNPRRFGFNPYTVQSTNAPFYSNPRIYTAAMCILTPDQQQDFLFIDGIHLTTAGQTIEADYTYNLLVAPSEISLLTESAVQGGWARAATIQGQIDPSAQHCRPHGYNVWTSAGTYDLEFKNSRGFANDSGAPFGGSVGLDYQLPNGVIVGAAFSAGSQTEQFSTGGNFNEVDEAPSLYVAYANGPWWGSAVLTYDLFQDAVTRTVPLGIFTDTNNANTCGDSLALALRGGRDFHVGRTFTGPVMGLIMQRAYVSAFSENGTSGVTALSFDSQLRDSAVGQLGWRLWADLNRWRPFVEGNWNHEFGERFRTVTTSLTTVSAPSYTMDAIPAASDWATLSLGSFYQINSRLMLRGAASATFINPQMTTCGGEVGLSAGF